MTSRGRGLRDRRPTSLLFVAIDHRSKYRSAMRASVLLLATVVACGGPVATAVAPSNRGAGNLTSQLVTVDWMNREYKLFEKSFAFKGGRYADTETVMQVSSPVYLDVTGDGVKDTLLPLQVAEAETALERGNPRFHSFLVFTIVNGEVVHLGELPMMTCGPLRAEVEGEWLRITSTRQGNVEDMCGGREHSKRYRWHETWFVNEDSDEVEKKLL